MEGEWMISTQSKLASQSFFERTIRCLVDSIYRGSEVYLEWFSLSLAASEMPIQVGYKATEIGKTGSGMQLDLHVGTNA
jgi:hypothetical protein